MLCITPRAGLQESTDTKALDGSGKILTGFFFFLSFLALGFLLLTK